MGVNDWITVMASVLALFDAGYCIVGEVNSCKSMDITISEEKFGGILKYNSSCPSDIVPQSSRKECVFVFDGTGNQTMKHANKSYTLEKLGFWLHKPDSYRLRLTNEGHGLNLNFNFYSTSTRFLPVRTNKLCKDAKYQECDDIGDAFEYRIILTDKPTCYKCGTPTVEAPKLNLSQTNIPIPDTQTSMKPEDAVKIVEQLSSLADLMGDRPAASVSIGEIKGVMVKPKDEDDLKQLTFGSSDTGLNIIQDESASNKLPLSVTVSKEAYQKSYQKKKNETIVGVFRFPNMTVGENLTALSDKVYAIEMGTNITNLSEPIQLKFNMKIPGRRNLSCQSWDGKGSEPNWTDAGCETVLHPPDQIVCECSHLTFFAVLMTPLDSEPISASDLESLTYISYIGCGVSVFFLGIALFMFFCIRKAKASNATHILLHLLMALFLLNVTFLTNEWVANLENDVGCKIMAAFMHYSMLSSFSWFAVEAFHLCLQMTKYSAVSIPHYKLKLSIAGWVPPVVVVLVIFILEKYGTLTIPAANGTQSKMCWIVDSTVHYMVNIGYYSIVFLFTFTIFVVMLRWLCYIRSSSKVKGQAKQQNSSSSSSSTRSSDVITIMGLCCTLGVAWSFAFFSHGALRLPSFYIFSILNSLQGLFLFIYYYNTSKLIGDGNSSSASTSSTATTTSKLGFHNPYENE